MDAVVKEISGIMKSYGSPVGHGDQYSAQWTVEAFAKHGITYLHLGEHS